MARNQSQHGPRLYSRRGEEIADAESVQEALGAVAEQIMFLERSTRAVLCGIARLAKCEPSELLEEAFNLQRGGNGGGQTRPPRRARRQREEHDAA